MQGSERRIADSEAGKRVSGMGTPWGCTPRKAEQQHLAGKVGQGRTPADQPCIVRKARASVREEHPVAVRLAC